jgi:hypothetical protein
VQLEHLKDEIPRKNLTAICSKYRHLPECYYGGDLSKFVTPAAALDAGSVVHPEENHIPITIAPKGNPTAKYEFSTPMAIPLRASMWEWYSGSSVLSKYYLDQGFSHLPPLDYRYGWNLSKHQHQEKALDALLSVGVSCLFASPNCAPWGNNSRSSPADQRAAKRAEESSTLQFLAVACFFQVLLGRQYIIESCAYSDIFLDSPLQFLRMLAHHLALLDQCKCGATLEGQPIRKRTHFQSSHVLHHLHIMCERDHLHLNLRGHGRAASAAQYTQDECRRILLDAKASDGTHEGGRILPSSQPFHLLSLDDKMAWLEELAESQCLHPLWEQIVVPWKNQQSFRLR